MSKKQSASERAAIALKSVIPALLTLKEMKDEGALRKVGDKYVMDAVDKDHNPTSPIETDYDPLQGMISSAISEVIQVESALKKYKAGNKVPYIIDDNDAKIIEDAIREVKDFLRDFGVRL